MDGRGYEERLELCVSIREVVIRTTISRVRALYQAATRSMKASIKGITLSKKERDDETRRKICYAHYDTDRPVDMMPLEPIRITLYLNRSGVNESLHQSLKRTVTMRML